MRLIFDLAESGSIYIIHRPQQILADFQNTFSMEMDVSYNYVTQLAAGNKLFYR